MPIHLAQTPDPLSERSRARTDALEMISSDAFELLMREMQRYADGEINGRSFLISGHRGAGKTTLVSHAFDRLAKQYAAQARLGQGSVRPLLVTLQGPSLLPRNIPAPPSGTVDGASADAEAENALVQITMALHRAVAREFADAYRRHVSADRVLLPRPLGHRLYLMLAGRDGFDAWRRWDRTEMAAQLEMELYECPGPMRLRQFWAGAGALHRGILFEDAAPARPADQGMRELVALAGVCEAYCRISGEYKQQLKESDAGKASAATEIKAEGSGRDLFGPLLTLLTGGLVGAAVAQQAASPARPFLAGIAAALAAAALLKFTASGSRSRDRSVSREFTFIYDLRLATLDRVLPILIERLRDAGLAPVFVVDELDKVQGLSRRIGGLVHHLKKLVAESSFFCFLTDRSYFEQMQARRRVQAYAVEYTYFSHPVFIVFDHNRLHEYLDSVMQLVSSGGGAGSAAHESLDLPVLRYLLLFRSQMHAIDLQRELAYIRNREGYVAIPAGDVRTVNAYRYAVKVQVAIEVVLDSIDLRARLRQEPEFRRLVHDALYYLARRWSLETVVDLGDSGFPAFDEYLAARVEKEDATPEGGNGGAPPAVVQAEDAWFLYKRVRAVAALLASNARFVAALADWNAYRTGRGLPQLPQPVADALQLGLTPSTQVDPPLLVQRLGTQVYEWAYDRSGRARASGAAPGQEVTPEVWKHAAEMIERFGAQLRDVSTPNGAEAGLDFEVLSGTVRILPSTPAWPTVDRAIQRLRAYEGADEPYAEYEDDVQCVRKFSDLLFLHAEAIARVVVCGYAVGQVARPAPTNPVLHGLEIIAAGFGFGEMDAAGTSAVLRKVEGWIIEGLSAQLQDSVGALSLAGTPEWRNAVSDRLKAVDLTPPFPEEWIGRAWHQARERVSHFLGTRTRRLPTLDELFCTSARIGPGALLRPDLNAMTVIEWSRAALAALGPPYVQGAGVPAWVLAAALFALGFRPLRWDLVREGVPPDVARGLDGIESQWPWLLATEAPRHAVLLVRPASAPTSLVETWLPHRAVAALALDADDLSRALDHLEFMMLLASFGPLHLAFEMPGLAKRWRPLRDRAFKMISRLIPELIIPVLLYETPPATTPRAAYAVAPRSLVDLFGGGMKGHATGQPAN